MHVLVNPPIYLVFHLKFLYSPSIERGRCRLANASVRQQDGLKKARGEKHGAFLNVDHRGMGPYLFFAYRFEVVVPHKLNEFLNGEGQALLFTIAKVEAMEVLGSFS